MDRPARILLVTTTPVPSPRGRPARLLALLRGVAAVARVDVLAPRAADQPHLETYAGARLLRVPLERTSLQHSTLLRAVERQLAAETYDVVHVDDAHLGAALLDGRDSGLVVELPEPGSGPVDEEAPRLHEDEVRCLREAEGIIVPSAIARAAAVSAGALETRVHVVGPAVELGSFQPSTLPDGTFHLLYAAGHEPWRGLPALIFALRLAAARSPILLRVVGTPDPQLPELVETLGLQHLVRFDPAVPHASMPLVLATVHAVVFPLSRCARNLRSGAAPQILAESLAAGRPVIAADVPAVRALLHDRLHGLLYPPGSEVDLARAIGTLAFDRPLLARLSVGARRQAEARFSSQDTLRALLSVYRAVLRGGDRPQLRPLGPVDHEGATQPALRLVRG